MSACGVPAAIVLLLLAGIGATPAQDEPASGGEAAKTSGDDAAKKDDASLEIEVENGSVHVFAVNADAHELFTELADRTNLQLIVDDSVKRKITINLTHKQPREAIDYIVSAYGFSFAEVEGVLIVSEGIPKNPSSYLLSEIDSVTAKYVQAPRAAKLLPVFLQAHVKLNPGQNAVVLSAPRSVLDKFRSDIEKFDQPAAQIALDVLVVEFTDTDMDTFAAELGWANNGKGALVDSLVGALTFRSVTDLAPDFFVRLDALVTRGKAKVRANPHISTVSGQNASVFIGQQQYLSTPVTLPGGGEGEFQRTSNSIDAGVRLNMRPLTGGVGEIILEMDEEVSTLSAPDPTTGLPNKSTRTARTIVRIKDGQTVVIGGLQQEETRSRRSRIPILSSLPLVGGLFRSKRIEQAKTDLAIFVTPRILTLTGHRSAEEEAELRERFGIPVGGAAEATGADAGEVADE